MKSPITTRLVELIDLFEKVYEESGATATLNLANLETGNASNVELTFRSRRLFVEIIGSGGPMLLVQTPPAVIARAAKHLPELSKQLDATIAIIERDSAAGLAVLERWFAGRDE
jgi:hypothetical protein